MALARYIGRKVAWTLVVFVVALLLNFLLLASSRATRSTPSSASLPRVGAPEVNSCSRSTSKYMEEFGLDEPLWQQFFIYVGNVFQGNLGTSFAQYPASVNTLIAQALPWSIAIMLPAIIVGWIVGNLLERWPRSRAAGWTGAHSSGRCSSPASRRSRWPSFCCSWSR